MRPSFLTFFAALCVGSSVDAAEGPRRLSYNRDIRPILSDNCFRCHGLDAAHRQANLRLDRREDAVANHPGCRPIVPGKPGESEVMRRLTSTDPDERMPPPGSATELKESEIELVRRWIEQGAEYEPHWAFIPPKRSPVPKVRSAWPRNPIDAFILAELNQEGLSPSGEADKATLLRRVTLDITGLPPTLDQLDAFLADDSTDAYEKVVDRLLASPQFGERMTLDWLDAARYADTNGYYTDAQRNAWPWRDWVIRAFNENMPFDRFTIDQLAGDLLPEPTVDQRVATGFNRNHMVTNESGVIDEEYRVKYVVDRVDTTATVWLGLTVECARCHDHKYDPISQREYYELFACFNSIQETGLVKDAVNPPPVLSLPTAEEERRLEVLRSERIESEKQLRALLPDLDRDIADWEKTLAASLAAAPTRNLLAHVSFDPDVRDIGPRNREISTIGTLSFSPGVRGRGATFDLSSYVEMQAPGDIDTSTPFTLAFWVKPGKAPSSCLVSKMDGSAELRGLEVFWYKSQPWVNLVHRWGHSAIRVVTEEKFSGDWHHLAVAYDGSGKASGLTLYVDGKARAIVPERDDLEGSIATDEPWRLGWKATGIGFDGSLDEVRLYDRQLGADEVETLDRRERLLGVVESPSDKRTRKQRDTLQAHYIADRGSDETRALVARIDALADEDKTVRGAIASTPVMHEMAGPRKSHVLVRGQYDQPAARVTPGVPTSLGSLHADAPRNRLGLAQWLVSPQHPLTARVTVNRLWQIIFGEGLVRTVNDFGLQGETPTHPELLDWLATHFIDSGWDVKGLVKLLVTSATYRQNSNLTEELLARDPENRLLARGPRYRLSAEAIRDQALAVGGLLVERVGGPSVKPYQPAGIWEAVSYNGDASYVPDKGEGLYRRSLYTFWKRQAPPPSILAFDGPTREICTVRRGRTNTPLQALVLLNDVTYIEAARGLATRTMRDGGADEDELIVSAHRQTTGREPSREEVQVLKKLYRRELAKFRKAPSEAEKLTAAGQSPRDASLDVCELAAWTATFSVLLNLDETITQH